MTVEVFVVRKSGGMVRNSGFIFNIISPGQVMPEWTRSPIHAVKFGTHVLNIPTHSEEYLDLLFKGWRTEAIIHRKHTRSLHNRKLSLPWPVNYTCPTFFGPSATNSKTVVVAEADLDCPTRVDRTNWLNEPPCLPWMTTCLSHGLDTFSDWFSITVTGNEVTAKREDSNAGWTTHLQFDCASRKSAPIDNLM